MKQQFDRRGDHSSAYLRQSVSDATNRQIAKKEMPWQGNWSVKKINPAVFLVNRYISGKTVEQKKQLQNSWAEKITHRRIIRAF